jgi:hypothetical protein
LVESFPIRSTWKYQPGNRSFIKQMPIYYPQNDLNHAETNTQPINVRLIDSYLQAVEDTRIRKQLGVDYTPWYIIRIYICADRLNIIYLLLRIHSLY